MQNFSIPCHTLYHEIQGGQFLRDLVEHASLLVSDVDMPNYRLNKLEACFTKNCPQGAIIRNCGEPLINSSQDQSLNLKSVIPQFYHITILELIQQNLNKQRINLRYDYCIAYLILSSPCPDQRRSVKGLGSSSL